MDKEKCPCCGHFKVFKIHTKEFLAADNDKVEKEKAEKILEWTKKAPSQRGKSP